jgi:hypothetical protein
MALFEDGSELMRITDRPLGGKPWATAPALPGSCDNQLRRMPLGPQGYTPSTVEDFRDVPILFASLMKYKNQLEPLALAFMGMHNAYRIHREISRIVYEQTGVIIEKQESQPLAQVMWAAYSGNIVRYRTGQLDRDLEELNRLVLDGMVPRVLSNLRSQLDFAAQVNQVQTPIPLPVSLSSKGIDGRSTYDLTRFLP